MKLSILRGRGCAHDRSTKPEDVMTHDDPNCIKTCNCINTAAKGEVQKNPSNTSNAWVVSMLVYIDVALIVRSEHLGETVSREQIWLTNILAWPSWRRMPMYRKPLQRICHQRLPTGVLLMSNLKAVCEPLNELSIPMFSDSIPLPKGTMLDWKYKRVWKLVNLSFTISVHLYLLTHSLASIFFPRSTRHPGPQGPSFQLVGILHME